MSASSPKLPPSLMLVTQSPFTCTWGRTRNIIGTRGASSQGPRGGTPRPGSRPLAVGRMPCSAAQAWPRSPPHPRPALLTPALDPGVRPQKVSGPQRPAPMGQARAGGEGCPLAPWAGKPAPPPPRRSSTQLPATTGLSGPRFPWLHAEQRRARTWVGISASARGRLLPTPAAAPPPACPGLSQGLNSRPGTQARAAVNGMLGQEGPGQDSLSAAWAPPARCPCCAFTAQARVPAGTARIVHYAERSLGPTQSSLSSPRCQGATEQLPSAPRAQTRGEGVRPSHGRHSCPSQ